MRGRVRYNRKSRRGRDEAAAVKSQCARPTIPHGTLPSSSRQKNELMAEETCDGDGKASEWRQVYAPPLRALDPCLQRATQPSRDCICPSQHAALSTQLSVPCPGVSQAVLVEGIVE